MAIAIHIRAGCGVVRMRFRREYSGCKYGGGICAKQYQCAAPHGRTVTQSKDCSARSNCNPGLGFHKYYCMYGVRGLERVFSNERVEDHRAAYRDSELRADLHRNRG